MIQIKKSQATAARRRIPFYFVDETNGITPVTGLTFSGSDIKLSKNGAAETNFAGAMTEIGRGLYYYEATAAELDTVGFLTVLAVKTGARSFPALVQVTELDPYDPAALGLTNLNTTVSSRAAPGDPMTLADNAITAAKIATDALTADKIADGAISSGKIGAGAIGSTEAPNLNATISSRAAPGDAMTLTAAYDAAKTAAKEEDGRLEAIDARLPTDPADESILLAAIATRAAEEDGRLEDIDSRLPASPASEVTVSAVGALVQFMKRMRWNKAEWDDVLKQWDIFNDAGDTIIYNEKPRTKTGGNITMSSTAPANRDGTTP